MMFFVFMLSVAVSALIAVFLYDRTEKNRLSDKTHVEQHLHAVSRRLFDLENNLTDLLIKVKVTEQIVDSLEKKDSGVDPSVIDNVHDELFTLKTAIQAENENLRDELFAVKSTIQSVADLKLKKKGPKWKPQKRKK